MKKAYFFKKVDGDKIICTLCPNYCLIGNGKTGVCGVRKNDNGTLIAQSYGMISSIALDPIEKKPLDFFMPGAFILSVGSYGCNFKCSFCQNWSISQEKPELDYVSPEELCNISLKTENNTGLAFTYNEPFINYEYVYETCRINKEQNKVNVLVTNGYINHEPLMEILPYIDAMNIDLKAFSEPYYKDVCGGKIEPVKQTIIESVKHCHVELTNLSVPGLNDSTEEMDEMCSWIASVNKTIPLHIIPFRPLYKMKNIPRQKAARLTELRETALNYLTRVVI